MESFEALFEKERSSIERFVRYRLNAHADSDDILQETYITAYQKFPQLKNQGSFKAWLISIARNKCNDYFRHKATQLEIPIDELNEKAISNGRFGITEIVAVRETLDLLGEKDKQILYLYFWKEMPHSEIAKQLSIPIGTVKSRLYSAKQSFKNKYPYYTEVSKGEKNMKKAPEYMPKYTITPNDKTPFSVKWEEMWGLFVVPKLNENCTWFAFDSQTKRCTEWGELTVVGKAEIHGIEGVEIHESRHNEATTNSKNYCYFAQLTDTHCRMLGEIHEKNGIRKLLTFLDGDDFLANWGYGEDNCGKQTDLYPNGLIFSSDGEIRASNTEQLVDIVGRYTVTINEKSYDTVRVISLDSYDGEYVACEQYLDQNGRTVLWRRFNRDDWAIDRYKKPWNEQLPKNDTLVINAQTYVHWYDCITEYVM